MPVPSSANPLNQGHCDCLNQVLANAPDVAEFLSCIERCGVDVSDLRQRAERNRERAEAIKREFFPDQP